jgi:hypothetical protein
VVKADGTLAGYKEAGELHVHTPAAALGYLNDDTAFVSSPGLLAE